MALCIRQDELIGGVPHFVSAGVDITARKEAEMLLESKSLALYRANTALQDGLMRTRMLPLTRHAQRLRRIVRQTADEAGKQCELRFSGAEGEIDREVLERIVAPLEHMLRNSVIHGIPPCRLVTFTSTVFGVIFLMYASNSAAIADEWQKFLNDGPTADELARVKTVLREKGVRD